MFKLALSISFVFALFHVTSWGEPIEKHEPKQVEDGFTAKIGKRHPKLTDQSQSILITRLYILSHEQDKLINSKEIDEQDRKYAVQVKDIIEQTIDLYISFFPVQQQAKTVIEQMKTEKKSGLKQISVQLIPRVQKIGQDMLSICLKAHQLDFALLQLQTEPLLGKTPQKTFDARSQMNETLTANLELTSSIASLLPIATSLILIEHIHY